MHIVYSDVAGKLFDSGRLRAVGRAGAEVTELKNEEWIPLPHGATMVSMPDTRALGIDPKNGTLTALPDAYCAVGALLPQGFTRLFLPAYHRPFGLEPLPLFGYTAVSFHQGKFYVAAIQTDDPQLWDPLQYDTVDVEKRVRRMQHEHESNRLYEHLETCALHYECVTARNTFFERNEAAIPVSSTCNAGCVGCISEQDDASGFPSPQTRLTIRPTVDEMVDLMCHHLRTAGPESIVSFGQGCEGEPSIRAVDIAEAIRRTKAQVPTGYINMNTNAGWTVGIKQIVDAGLDLMRISTISALQDHYAAYYRPRGYNVEDVEASAFYASQHGVIVSLNYLVFPGVSDRREEIEAMIGLIARAGIRLVQFRNLNIDADYYLQKVPAVTGEPIGMLNMMREIQSRCPSVRLGSYTHPVQWYRSAGD